MTAAQRENLRYLLEHYGEDSFPSNALMGAYEDRARREHERDPLLSKFGWRADTNRLHGWRRTSGRVLAQMQRVGLLEPAAWDRYTPRYRVSAEGRALMEDV